MDEAGTEVDPTADQATADEVARSAVAAMWREDAASAGLGMRLVSAQVGRAVLEMPIRSDMVNGHGIAHGGFVFALADSAFAFACNSHNRRTVAQACDIVFVAPARLGDVLVAEAVERARFGRNGIYDVTVRRDGDLVAEFRGRSREIAGTLVDPHSLDTSSSSSRTTAPARTDAGGRPTRPQETS